MCSPDDSQESVQPTMRDTSDIPFRMVCLLHGHGDCDGLDPHVRKALLSRFNAFVRRLPIECHTFSYSSYDVGGVKELSARMRRDLVNFVYEHLEGFRSFDCVATYYASSVKQTRQWRVCSEKAA